MNACFSAMRHELSNSDSSKRIRRSQQNLFDHGGMIAHIIFGYVKPRGAKTDDQLEKDPAAAPVFAGWFQKLNDGASFAEVADWLNELGVTVGPGSRNKKWDSRMVGRVTHNAILKGVREWNRKFSRRNNGSGKYLSVDAPPEMLRTRECPHLAFFSAEYYDEVIRKVNERNAVFHRAKEGQRDPRKGVPKKRTIWPAQHMHCGVCGRPMYCQGPAKSRILICSGATNYQCWNSVAVSLERAGQKLLDAILDAISKLPDFDETLRANVATTTEEVLALRSKGRLRIEAEMANLDLQLARLGDQVFLCPRPSETLSMRILDTEDRRKELEREYRELLRRPAPTVALPRIGELRQMAREMLGAMRRDSPELSRSLHTLAPALHAYPYQLIDGGHIVLRAAVEFDLCALLPASKEMPRVREHLMQPLVVDLYDAPQREEYRARVWDLTNSAEGLNEREIAARLGITQPAVQYAKSLQRLLDASNRSDPYVPVTEPPGSGKLRRHKHERFQFTPLPGLPQDWPAK